MKISLPIIFTCLLFIANCGKHIVNSEAPIIHGLTDTGTGTSGTTVLKYNAGQWMSVGRQSLAALPSWGTSIAIDSSNAPVIAFMNHDGNYKACRVLVRRFDGSKWIKTGFPSASKTVTNVEIAVDEHDNYYIAYSDMADSCITVKCFK